MNFQWRQISHWGIVLLSGLLLVAAAIRVRLSKSREGPTRIAFFSAVERPTITRLVQALIDAGASNVEIIRCSFFEPSASEVEKLPDHVGWVRLTTWQGALSVARCDLVVTADRIRTLGALLHLLDTPFIDVWHGISFKGIKRPRFLAFYREVWVSSPFIRDLYVEKLGVARSRLQVLGFSPSDPLIAVGRGDGRTPEVPRLHRPQILVAPTWDRESFGRKPEVVDRYWQDESFLAELAERAEVDFVVRSHHLTREPPSASEHVRVQSQLDDADPANVLLSCDVLVTDWSSLAFEFLPLFRPTIFLESSLLRPSSFLVEPSERWGPIISNREEFVSSIIGLRNRDFRLEGQDLLKHESAAEKFHLQLRLPAAPVQASRLIKIAESANNSSKRLSLEFWARRRPRYECFNS